MSMLEFNADGTPTFELKGKNIMFGETDGSSYPNGGGAYAHVPFSARLPAGLTLVPYQLNLSCFVPDTT